MDPDRRRLLITGALFGAVIAGTLAPTACALIRRPGPSREPPRRPAGTPAPPLDDDLAPILARLDRWYAAHLPPDLYRFNPPATDARLDAFERGIGRRMPPAWRALYRWHDGEEADRHGHFYGLPLLPLDRALAEWTAWQRVLGQFGGNRYVVPAASWPAGAVDPAYAHPGWIPLTADGSGGHIGLDLDPWPGGRVGQVILFGRDEDVKLVLAPSLGRFLGWIADLLESGNVRLDTAPGETVLRSFRLKSPPVDHFAEGARRLLGAPGPFL